MGIGNSSSSVTLIDALGSLLPRTESISPVSLLMFVPNLVNLPYTTAMERCEEYHLIPSVEWENSEEERGKVLRQNVDSYLLLLTDLSGNLNLEGFVCGKADIASLSHMKCAARGIFRLHGISPCAGDNVRVEVTDNAEPVIAEIFERKNYLVRPPLANLDGIIFVNSCTQPSPNRFVLDKLVAIEAQ